MPATPAANTPNHAKSSSTSAAKSPSPSRTMTPAKGTPNAVAQTKAANKPSTGSPLSARGSVSRPGQAPRSESTGGISDESKAETSALLEDLKEQLRKAETASDEYQKQAAVLQSKLDDALNDHSKFEENAQENSIQIERLEKERQDQARKYRDLEAAFENDKVASMKEREDTMMREQELTDTVQRLKESLSNRDKRGSVDGESLLTRATSLRGRSSPRAGNESPDPGHRDSSQNNAKLILQKDKVIESLRLELAEAQIKLVELENKGGGHTQELEKMLLEARMSNAKLMEDNESYQVLLSEKTLNGDFAKSNLLDPNGGRSDNPEPPKTPSLKPVSGSLADELDTPIDGSDDERVRRLEADLAAQKDQNKALTLYINKIITRLLQNETFEQLFENGSITGDNPLKHGPESSPPKESAEDINAEAARKAAEQNKENTQASTFLQRAGSIFGGKRQRPQNLKPSQPSPVLEEKQRTPTGVPPPSSPPQPGQHLTIPNENPDAAPSIPLRRSASGRGHARIPSMRASHRRATSDLPGAANVVNNMNRSASGSNNGLHSPTGLASPRSASGPLLSPNVPPPLILENTEPGDAEINTRSEVASDSGYGESVMSKAPSDFDQPSSPRAAAAAALEGSALPAGASHKPSLSRSDTNQSNEGKQASGPSTWFNRDTNKAADNKPGMRPLRLVQEKAEADEAEAAARKKANRSSFMGWFNKGQGGQQQPNATSPPQVVGGLGSPPPIGMTHARRPSYDSRPSSGGEIERSPPR